MAITNASGVGAPGSLPGDPGSEYLRSDGPPWKYKRMSSGWVAADVIDDTGAIPLAQLDPLVEQTGHKNAANGYAGLDGSSKLNGSHQVYGSAANTACQGNDSRLNTGSAATPASTGTMTVNMTTAVITITPTGSCTFNASGGVTGQLVTFVITTSGTTSFTLTFGTNFISAGTLATGTVTAKKFSVTFRCVNGTSWQEIARTGAM